MRTLQGKYDLSLVVVAAVVVSPQFKSCVCFVFSVFLVLFWQ
jgi:hypothetical protein